MCVWACVCGRMCACAHNYMYVAIVPLHLSIFVLTNQNDYSDDVMNSQLESGTLKNCLPPSTNWQ